MAKLSDTFGKPLIGGDTSGGGTTDLTAYVTKSLADTIYLKTSDAVATNTNWANLVKDSVSPWVTQNFLNKTDAASAYLLKTDAVNTYALKSDSYTRAQIDSKISAIQVGGGSVSLVGYATENWVTTTFAASSWVTNNFAGKTGTGASGTWGINITGNAATSTTATTATNANQLGGVPAADYAKSAWVTGNFLPRTEAQSYFLPRSDATTNYYTKTEVNNTFGNYLTTQGVMDYANGNFVRRAEAANNEQFWANAVFNTTQQWYPSKTGVGASGTWGISISGNAVTATNAYNLWNATNSTWLDSTVFIAYCYTVGINLNRIKDFLRTKYPDAPNW